MATQIARVDERLRHLSDGFEDLRRRTEALELRYLHQLESESRAAKEGRANAVRTVLTILAGPLVAVVVSVALNKC